MTIKEMFKKIETYNEIAEMVKTEKLRIYVNIGHFHSIGFSDFNSFKKYIRNEYIREVEEAILKYDGYAFEVEHKFNITMWDGYKITETVEINAYAA